jgi:protein-S-isoprenylcysteine O-methyltransferase Ste14
MPRWLERLLAVLGVTLLLGGTAHLVGVARFYLAEGVPEPNRLLLDLWIGEAQLLGGALYVSAWRASRRRAPARTAAIAGALIVIGYAAAFLPVLVSRAPVTLWIPASAYLLGSAVVLLVAAAGTSSADRAARARALLGTLVFLLVAPGTVAGLVPWWISRWRVQPALLGAPSRLAGAVLAAAGLAVLLDSFARFALRGLGTPAPVLPTRHLVVSGLYRFVRNPMYLAVVSLIAGQGLLLGDARLLGYAVLVWLACHAFVIAYEEPTLRRTFGSEYEAFCASVPRWIPRRPR